MLHLKFSHIFADTQKFAAFEFQFTREKFARYLRFYPKINLFILSSEVTVIHFANAAGSESSVCL